MKEKQSPKNNLLISSILIFLKGVVMGSADIVPGVSGGTMALISGIYQRLIDGINGVYELFSLKTLQSIIKLRWKPVWKKIKKIDFAFFIPLFAGIMLAFLSLAHLIEFVMTEYTVGTYAFFFGLILASAFFLFKQIEAVSKKRLFTTIIGIIIGFTITGLETIQANHSQIVIFLSGAIAITAMILPGISGSFMLVMMNQYKYIIHAIKTFDIDIILLFGLGAFFGLMAFAKFLTFMLHHHKNGTFSFLVGLMLGSLHLQYTIISNAGLTIKNGIILLIAGSIGFILVFGIEKISSKL